MSILFKYGKFTTVIKHPNINPQINTINKIITIPNNTCKNLDPAKGDLNKLKFVPFKKVDNINTTNKKKFDINDQIFLL